MMRICLNEEEEELIEKDKILSKSNHGPGKNHLRESAILEKIEACYQVRVQCVI